MSDFPIRFYLDYLSSNVYLAWTQLPALAQRFGRAIEPVPVLFAGLLEAHGQVGPAEVLPKAWWMAKNNLRKAALLGVPLHPPAFHPFNPLLALRVTSLPMDAVSRARLVGGLLRGVWAERRHVSDPNVVAQIASEAGLDGAALVAAAQQPDVKAALRKQTDDAIALGIFGVPTVLVDGELFLASTTSRSSSDSSPAAIRSIAACSPNGRARSVPRRCGANTASARPCASPI